MHDLKRLALTAGIADSRPEASRVTTLASMTQSLRVPTNDS